MGDLYAHLWNYPPTCLFCEKRRKTCFNENSPVVVEIIAYKVGIACVNTLEAARFFTNISGNKQLGARFTRNSAVVVEQMASKFRTMFFLIYTKTATLKLS
ncbi:hypothetical protein T11_11418 [Trichinella zimbabwensis]|uniref:Uncharacterized protein n=1 Tax=Trichinella zimbabwensis TaxID=268475 RepID=A0A0V1HMY2_9BILA|nr:hypothetical protein T11_11418 [Trichinella zimbabwensis]